MNQILNDIEKVNKKILQKCTDVGRNISEITLVAVSKQNPIEVIELVADQGILNFGENKAKELSEKASKLKRDISWHFIGHLQTNKVKDVVPVTYLIHSVESIKLADEINKRAGNINKIQNILLEVKTSTEATKFGCENIESLLSLAAHCISLQNIKLSGLMTMAPFTEDENLIRASFKKLAWYKEKLKQSGIELKHLSMGMTNDFEIAIEEGATILRIGTAIFGQNN